MLAMLLIKLIQADLRHMDQGQLVFLEKYLRQQICGYLVSKLSAQSHQNLKAVLFLLA